MNKNIHSRFLILLASLILAQEYSLKAGYFSYEKFRAAGQYVGQVAGKGAQAFACKVADNPKIAACAAVLAAGGLGYIWWSKSVLRQMAIDVEIEKAKIYFSVLSVANQLTVGASLVRENAIFGTIDFKYQGNDQLAYTINDKPQKTISIKDRREKLEQLIQGDLKRISSRPVHLNTLYVDNFPVTIAKENSGNIWIKLPFLGDVEKDPKLSILLSNASAKIPETSQQAMGTMPSVDSQPNVIPEVSQEKESPVESDTPSGSGALVLTAEEADMQKGLDDLADIKNKLASYIESRTRSAKNKIVAWFSKKSDGIWITLYRKTSSEKLKKSLIDSGLPDNIQKLIQDALEDARHQDRTISFDADPNEPQAIRWNATIKSDDERVVIGFQELKYDIALTK
ncbi:MAG: hypothetical protein WC707_05000 [Candidatus Babeliaceae bacterium]|jgi:hypothetical protein